MAGIGDFIREERLKKDWSLEKLANVCGLSYVTVSRLERGFTVQRTSFRLVCRGLELDPGDFEEGIQFHNPWRNRKQVR